MAELLVNPRPAHRLRQPGGVMRMRLLKGLRQPPFQVMHKGVYPLALVGDFLQPARRVVLPVPPQDIPLLLTVRHPLAHQTLAAVVQISQLNIFAVADAPRHLQAATPAMLRQDFSVMHNLEQLPLTPVHTHQISVHQPHFVQMPFCIIAVILTAAALMLLRHASAYVIAPAQRPFTVIHLTQTAKTVIVICRPPAVRPNARRQAVTGIPFVPGGERRLLTAAVAIFRAADEPVRFIVAITQPAAVKGVLLAEPAGRGVVHPVTLSPAIDNVADLAVNIVVIKLLAAAVRKFNLLYQRRVFLIVVTRDKAVLVCLLC